MADESAYSTATDTTPPSSTKRKFDDQPAPPPSTRRQTGFSSPISDPAPPLSYNSVPPPVDEIQMAKQKAQEIAARIMSGAGADIKRPRVENGASGFDSVESNKGYSSAPPDMKSTISNSAPSSIPASYGSYLGGSGLSKKIDIPQGRVGVIIGKGGETIKYLQLQSGAKIQVTRDMDADPNSPSRMVELMGTPEQISKAEQLINDAEAGGSGTISRRYAGQGGSEHFSMKIPNNKVGLVIGKGGESIKNMQARSGARIQVIPLHLPPGDTSTERTVHIEGTSEQVEAAKQLVNEVTSENRMRNPSMGGSYPEQGYQARPPTSWGPSSGPPVQQGGYGYMQTGAYPGASAPYNMSQPAYPGYPPQQPSGGYPSNWDQSSVSANQQNQGYDYYSQPPSSQQQTSGGAAAPADSTGYNYSQAPASGYNQQGQGYSQDGYGGYQQPGYGQPPPYDQQQAQGDSAQGPSQPSSMGQQGYSTGQQPSPNPASYPPQGAAQPGYGLPPSSQSGYGRYAPPYGAPPAGQPGYGQGPPPYSSASYGSGYSQPAAYSADGNATSNARGTYESAPASQTAQQVELLKHHLKVESCWRIPFWVLENWG
ncbi:far upstream element-binding protein [Salix suchowensis]|nr:far upstream element-binding protein [Salix suchowensis]